jgi:hypothetical protein
MLVHLRRDFFLDGVRYRQNAAGTGLPDTLKGRRVVLASDPGRTEGDIVLPKDCVAYAPGLPTERNTLIRNSGPPPTTTMSALSKKKVPIPDDE